MTQFLIEGNGWPAGRNTRVEVGGQLTLQLPGQLLEKMFMGGKRIKTLLIKGTYCVCKGNSPLESELLKGVESIFISLPNFKS